MVIQPTRRRFTVDEYYRMVSAGLLSEDDRVELIDGEIIEMTPMGSPHASVVTRVTRSCFSWAGEGALIRVQLPVRLGDYSEPEPDLALVRSRADAYAGGHPGPADVLLLVEVSSSSLAFDRSVKVPLYARWGVTELWIVDVAAQAVEVHRRPGPDGYAEFFVVGNRERLAPLAFPDQEVEVSSIAG